MTSSINTLPTILLKFVYLTVPVCYLLQEVPHTPVHLVFPVRRKRDKNDPELWCLAFRPLQE